MNLLIIAIILYALKIRIRYRDYKVSLDPIANAIYKISQTLRHLP